MSEFPLYRSPGSAESGDRLWYVLVECPSRSPASPAARVRFGVDEAFGDFEAALAAAERCAFTCWPGDTPGDNGRQVFRTGDRDFTTIIDCGWTSHHFVTRVAQHVGDVTTAG
ncbi:hypothetical protein [Microlunatus speluncae]|uniref:hypothetical protein n=1 Tax=Microlunatus speluncae TaxID=2594267 RepID=UPI00126645E6|nr:hypothetical protein [Microlunatus speluncae]